ncbi:MAG: hypothetical protein PHC92_06790 [Syntrophomonadaceae bacterium]|nr:hypothetical protein [Syntrophomonadaceae bacterium]MDD3023682.1 hypothetical protein [Syntrophomonadaceae bacterium]
MKSHEMDLEADAIVQIKTRKYQAIPLENNDEETLLSITTARRSSFEAQNICPKCGKKISPGESRICESCGSNTCIYCLRAYQDTQ